MCVHMYGYSFDCKWSSCMVRQRALSPICFEDAVRHAVLGRSSDDLFSIISAVDDDFGEE
jgi:hypothetical protein